MAKKKAARRRTQKKEYEECFVIMPISDPDGYEKGHFRRVYEDLIIPACAEAELEPTRADESARTNLIQLEILKQLLEAPMAICDLSSRNPNVMFELGMRQAFDMPVALIQEEGTPQIFDISGLRYSQYSSQMSYRSVLADRKKISEMLKDTKEQAEEGGGANSLVKLLSLERAVMDVPEGDRTGQYFEFLKTEIHGIRHDLQGLQKTQSGIGRADRVVVKNYAKNINSAIDDLIKRAQNSTPTRTLLEEIILARTQLKDYCELVGVEMATYPSTWVRFEELDSAIEDLRAELG